MKFYLYCLNYLNKYKSAFIAYKTKRVPEIGPQVYNMGHTDGVYASVLNTSRWLFLFKSERTLKLNVILLL